MNQKVSPRVSTQFQESETRSVAFIFPGEDTLYPDMGKELYQTESVFRAQVERCCLILQPYLELDLLSLIYPSESEREAAAEKRLKSLYSR